MSGRTTRGSAGHGGDRLPHSTSANMAGRNPSRYRADGEGDDASGGDRTPLVGLVVVAMIPVAWIASVVAYALVRS